MRSLDPIRSKALDGLRGVAVLQVMLFHYFCMTPATKVGTISAFFFWTKSPSHAIFVMQKILNCVDGLGIFFALSGFFIGGTLLDNIKATNWIPVFYGRRAFRILPLYWMLLGSFALVRMVDGSVNSGLIKFWTSDIPFWHYFVFTQNNSSLYFGLPVPWWLTVTWSLCVEEQFYLLLPWVVQFLSTKALAVLSISTIVVCPLLRFVDTSTASIDSTLVGSLDRLMIGVLVAVMVRSDTCVSFLSRHLAWLKTALAGFFAWIVWSNIFIGTTAHHPAALTNLLVYGALICVLSLENEGFISRAFGFLSPFGLGSYCIYLFHMPVMYLMTIWTVHYALYSLPAVFLLAYLSYRWFECPLIALGHRLKYRRPRHEVVVEKVLLAA